MKILAIVAAIILALYLVVYVATAPQGFDDSLLSTYNPLDEPVQEDLTDAEPVATIAIPDGEAIITPKARYHVAAKVGGVKRYRDKWGSYVARHDVVLLWGQAASDEAKPHMNISQSMRWYHFRIDEDSPFDVQYMIRHSANTHLIPANKNIERAINRLSRGDVINLEGYLVSISGTWKGGTIWWHSSLTRNDTGDGSCEVLYVERLRKDGKSYE